MRLSRWVSTGSRTTFGQVVVTIPENPQDVHVFTLPHDDNTIYYVKTRPHVQHFLQEARKMYELHIYTMGTRTYADAVAKALDPEGTLFGGRVLSRDESGSGF